MSVISDYKSAPFDLNVQAAAPSNYVGTATPAGPGYTGTGLNGIPDYSYDSLCGVKFATTDGRTVAIVRNAATALTVGVLVQEPAEVTAFEKMAITVPAAYPATAGTYQILVTNGATKINVNQFQGGYLIVASGTGKGQTLQIAGNQNGIASTSTFVVTLQDPIQTTLDATSTVSLIANPYTAVIIAPAAETGAPIGVTAFAIGASVAPTFNATTGALVTAGTPVYGFVVTHGPVGCLIDTVTNVGYPVGRSASVAGAVSVATLTTAAAVGTNMQTQTDTQVGLIYLNL